MPNRTNVNARGSAGRGTAGRSRFPSRQSSAQAKSRGISRGRNRSAPTGGFGLGRGKASPTSSFGRSRGKAASKSGLGGLLKSLPIAGGAGKKASSRGGGSRGKGALAMMAAGAGALFGRQQLQKRKSGSADTPASPTGI